MSTLTAIQSFIRRHAFKIMLIGMMIACIGVLVLILIRTGKISADREISVVVGVLGLFIYAVGRIAHFINMKKGKEEKNDLKKE